MKTNYKFLILILISFITFAQDKKFSIEVNYPLGLSEGFVKYTGIADASIKYRFAESEIVKYGVSFTFDYLKAKVPYNYQDLGWDYFFYHINAFAEMNIPSAEKIHPFVGAGFTYVSYKREYLNYYEYDFEPNGTIKEKAPGFNLKLGIQYDLTSSFFVQSYFHYIKSFNKNEFTNETFGANFNQIKFGLGFRF